MTSISNAAFAVEPVGGEPIGDAAQLRAWAHRHGVAVEVDDVADDVGGAGPVGRGDQRRQIGPLMEVAERLATPVVPPREERRAADVVTEHELGDGVAERQRGEELARSRGACRSPARRSRSPRS